MYEDECENIKKSGLSFWVSVLLCINTMNGPGLVSISYAYSVGGIAFTTFGILLIAYITIETACFLIDTIKALSKGPSAEEMIQNKPNYGSNLTINDSNINSNDDTPPHEHKWEFTRMALFISGPNMELLTLFMLTLCLLALELAQMILCSQVMDAIVIFLCGESFAFDYYNFFHNISPFYYASSELSLRPFGEENEHIISVGFFITAIICLLCSLLDLSQSAPQKLCFLLLVLAACILSVDFSEMALKYEPGILKDAFADRFFIGEQPTEILGIVIFNFAYIIAVPSLVAEASKSYNFKKVVMTATAFNASVYICVGVTGCFAYLHPLQDLLKSLVVPTTFWVDFVAVAFYIISQMAAIPIYGILIEKNLIEAEVCSNKMAYIIANIIPWIMVMFLYMSGAFEAVIDWASLLILGFVNYSIPLWLFIKMTMNKRSTVGDIEPIFKNWKLMKAILIFSLITFLIVFVIFEKLNEYFNSSLNESILFLVVFLGLLTLCTAMTYVRKWHKDAKGQRQPLIVEINP